MMSSSGVFASSPNAACLSGILCSGVDLSGKCAIKRSLQVLSMLPVRRNSLLSCQSLWKMCNQMASGVFASSPNAASLSGNLCSGVNLSGKCATKQPETEMSCLSSLKKQKRKNVCFCFQRKTQLRIVVIPATFP